MQSDIWNIEGFLRASNDRGYIYDPPLNEGVCGSRVTRQGKSLVNFCAINFLCLQEEPRWMNRFMLNSKEYGLVTGGSRATQGASRAHWLLEEKISRLTGKPRTLTFASGMLANIGFLNAMSARFVFDHDCRIDNSDAVFVMDRESHWSLWKSADHLVQNQQLFSFRHNDPQHLEQVLRKIHSKKVVVIFETVYSADGSVAPVQDLLDVCERCEVLSFVDDANGFVVYGAPNRPFYKEYQALSRATFRMVSLSKAVGLEGGAISAPMQFATALEILSGTFIFTAAMQPPTAATAADIIDYLEDEDPALIDGYLHRSNRFRERLIQLNFRLYDFRSYIISILIGDDMIAEQVRLRLLDAGYCVPVFRYPAVKHNQAIARLILNNRHSEEDMEGFMSTLVKLRDEFRF